MVVLDISIVPVPYLEIRANNIITYDFNVVVLAIPLPSVLHVSRAVFIGNKENIVVNYDALRPVLTNHELDQSRADFGAAIEYRIF